MHDDILWLDDCLDLAEYRLHSCKIMPTIAPCPRPLLAYCDDAAPEVLAKALADLNGEYLPKQAQAILGVAVREFVGVKLLGSMVLADDTRSLALRLQFTNTTKNLAHHLHIDNTVLHQECQKCFAYSLDVLYKGKLSLYSLADDTPCEIIKGNYQRLPDVHAVAHLATINQSLSLFSAQLHNYLPAL